MPLVILSIVIQLVCLVHAAKTGRPTYWYFVILFGSLLGCAAYFIVEIIPSLRHSRAAKRVTKDITEVVDPDRTYRESLKRLDQADTVENRVALARACADRGEFDTAIQLYESVLTGMHADDPGTMQELAEVYLRKGAFQQTISTLDRLRTTNPDYQSQDGHLLYARALEEQGDREAARQEYEALIGYFRGEEARCRYALLLQKDGRVGEARQHFETLVRAVDRAGKRYFREQRDWYRVAKQNLS